MNVKMTDQEKCVEFQERARESMFALMNELNEKLVEREELIGLVMLAVFSGQNMFLIGKPGVGKTKALKLILDSVEGAVTFEHLMMYDTKPDAIFGRSHVAPNGEIVHNFEHSAVAAHYILEDEFFKGSSEIINAYLGMTSQNREYHPAGMEPVRVPLMSFFAASNEFPQGEVLDAMNDRLPLRYEVKRIVEDENFCRMVEGDLDTSGEVHAKLSLDIVKEVSGVWVNEVKLPRALSSNYAALKRRLVIEENIEASDRRLDDAVRIMRTAAYLNGRWEIDESDFFLLNHIIWNDYREREKTRDGLKRHFFTSSKFVEKLLSDAESEFSRLNALKQSHLNPFLTKSEHVPLKDLEDYYIANMNGVVQLMSALNASYGKIVKICAIEENNNRILDLIRENVFIVDQDDEVFVGDIPERIKRCDEDYFSLYRYLDEFCNECPDMRAYKAYKGKHIGGN
jgi:MoxR-like ATPase